MYLAVASTDEALHSILGSKWSRRTTVQTIKTAVVVVLLLVVLYGAYIAINGANTDLPPELQAMLENESNLDVDISMPGPSTHSSLGASETNSGTFSGTSGLKPAAAPTFGGSTPTFGSLAPPQLATVPTPAPAILSTPSFPSSSNPKANFVPGVNTLAPMLTSAPSTLELDEPEEAPFSLNVKDNPAKISSSMQSPSDFGLPTKMVRNPNTATGDLANADSTSQTSDNSNEPQAPAKSGTLTGRSYESAKQVAMEQISRGQMKEALTTVSVFYGSPELSESQTRDLIDLLDSLAGEVIYSRRHLLDTPYVVGPGESIESIAKRFEIPAELLARINAVDLPGGLQPGTKLKVFQGPFRAEVDMKRNEMTVFLGELYAGRFPISTGADPAPKEGVFQVLDKQRNRNYYGLGGTQIDGFDPRNPYGGWWIDLGQDVSIHGTATSGGPENAKLGCISLSPLDAGDVFSMLSRGSQVTIKR